MVDMKDPEAVNEAPKEKPPQGPAKGALEKLKMMFAKKETAPDVAPQFVPVFDERSDVTLAREDDLRTLAKATIELADNRANVPHGYMAA